MHVVLAGVRFTHAAYLLCLPLRSFYLLSRRGASSRAPALCNFVESPVATLIGIVCHCVQKDGTPQRLPTEATSRPRCTSSSDWCCPVKSRGALPSPHGPPETFSNELISTNYSTVTISTSRCANIVSGVSTNFYNALSPFRHFWCFSFVHIHSWRTLSSPLLPAGFVVCEFSQEHAVGFDDERDRGQKRRRLSPVKGQQGWEQASLSTPTAVPPTPARRSTPKPLPPNSSRYLLLSA